MELEHFGAISLIPVLFVILFAVFSKRTFEPLLFGSILGFILLEGGNFFPAWLDAVYTVMMDGVTVWVILVCGLFGSLIALLEQSGGASGFSISALKLTRTRKASLLTAWVLGMLIFVDDYLNALSVGVAMRKVTDAFKAPRELLAYVINSTGATVCVLVPFSTWSAFMAGQLGANDVTVGGSATTAFIYAIPFIFYGWVALAVVPLFILKIIPTFGPMKLAELRAQHGNLFPPGSQAVVESEADREAAAGGTGKKPQFLNFIIPMLILAAITIITKDMLWGVCIAIASCLVLYLPQKLMGFGAFWDSFMKGFQNMLPALGIVVAAFFLQQANEGLGLTAFVIESVQPIMTGALLPAITFIVVALIAFATGSFWGVAAISLPIIIPLAQAYDVSVFLASGAVISAAAFGSHACFYGDAVTLTCTSTQIPNIEYAKTVIPLIMVPTVITIILYLVAGYLL